MKPTIKVIAKIAVMLVCMFVFFAGVFGIGEPPYYGAVLMVLIPAALFVYAVKKKMLDDVMSFFDLDD